MALYGAPKMALKLFDVEVIMVSKKKHPLRMKARSADAAMKQVIKDMAPFEVFSMRVREVKNEQAPAVVSSVDSPNVIPVH